MTHTSTEQERDLKDIEQAMRLVREAHQHEVDAYRPELYKPECDRRPKPQLDRLGDLICLLQNILYAAQQASRRAQVVPQGWKLVPDDANMTDEQAEAICAVAKVCGGGAYDIYRAALAAAPQPPEAAPVPQFSRIAQKKLDYLLEAGEAITGYAIENKDGRRGAIDCHGFVYWWQDAAAPQQLVNHDIQEQST